MPTFSRQASIAVKVEWKSSSMGERRDLETPPPTASVDKEDVDGGRAAAELKLSGEKQIKKGVNLRGLSFSRQPTCPRSFERRLKIQLKI